MRVSLALCCNYVVNNHVVAAELVKPLESYIDFLGIVFKWAIKAELDPGLNSELGRLRRN